MKNYSITFVFLVLISGEVLCQNHSEKSVRTFSYYNVTGVSTYFGENSGKTFEMTNGFFFREKCGVGIGLGVLLTSNYSLSTVGFDTRYHLSNGKSHPSLTLKGGYHSSNNRVNAYKGREGYYFGVAISMNIYLGNRLHLQSSVGIRHDFIQRYSHVMYCWDGSTMVAPEEILNQNVLEMRLSIFFH